MNGEGVNWELIVLGMIFFSMFLGDLNRSKQMARLEKQVEAIKTILWDNRQD
jgi:hypothetical protein